MHRLKEKKCIYIYVYTHVAFPGGSDGKESDCNVADLSSIPGLGRSPKGGMAAHASILAWRIPMDRGAWQLQSMGLQRVSN